jgi:hypothetical protein
METRTVTSRRRLAYLARRDNQSNNNDQNAKPSNPLALHALWGGGVEHVSDYITYTSTKNHNEAIGNPSAESNAALVVTAGSLKVNGIGFFSCPFKFKPEQVPGVLNHPKSTKIFMNDGEVNYDRLEELELSYGEIINGEVAITEKSLYLFLMECRKKDNEDDTFGIDEKIVSAGEWEGFWRETPKPLFSGYKDNGEDNGEKFVTMDDLIDFYEDTRRLDQREESRFKPELEQTEPSRFRHGM